MGMSSSSTDSPCVDSGNVTVCTTSSVVTKTVVEATQVEEGAAGPTLKLRLVQKEKVGSNFNLCIQCRLFFVCTFFKNSDSM